jgi:23S rRNA pseudouridine1911/1915/1917 synthase
MNQGWIYRDQVRATHAGMTVLDYYTQSYHHSSRAAWQQRILTHQIYLDAQPTTPETRLKTGQRLTYHRPPWAEPAVPLAIEVVHDDQDVLVVAKPSGLPVLPGGGFLEHTLLGQLKRYYPNETPYPIHRLGRGTSGLVLLARSPLARANLSQQMRDRQVRKVYRALVGAGELPDSFTITQPIGKIPHPQLGYVYGAVADGRSALSQCQVLHRTPNSTLLEILIHTGRPHQIRIHLASVGFPLIGDPLYLPGGIPRQWAVNPVADLHQLEEKSPVPGDCGYHLHAYTLTFVHPSTQKPIHVCCPTPPVLTYPSG